MCAEWCSFCDVINHNVKIWMLNYIYKLWVQSVKSYSLLWWDPCLEKPIVVDLTTLSMRHSRFKVDGFTI